MCLLWWDFIHQGLDVWTGQFETQTESVTSVCNVPGIEIFCVFANRNPRWLSTSGCKVRYYLPSQTLSPLTLLQHAAIFRFRVTVADQNFPNMLKANYEGQLKEIVRKCVEPPIRKKPGYSTFLFIKNFHTIRVPII